MPFTAASYVCNSGAAIKIVPASVNYQHVVVHAHNHQSNDDIFVGDYTLGTALNGIHVPDGLAVLFTLPPGADLWAISETSTPTIQVAITTL
jgi:hypothetical protein